MVPLRKFFLMMSLSFLIFWRGRVIHGDIWESLLSACERRSYLSSVMMGIKIRPYTCKACPSSFELFFLPHWLLLFVYGLHLIVFGASPWLCNQETLLDAQGTIIDTEEWIHVSPVQDKHPTCYIITLASIWKYNVSLVHRLFSLCFIISVLSSNGWSSGYVSGKMAPDFLGVRPYLAVLYIGLLLVLCSGRDHSSWAWGHFMGAEDWTAVFKISTLPTILHSLALSQFFCFVVFCFFLWANSHILVLEPWRL